MVYFFLISSNYVNTEVTFNLLMRKNSSMEKLRRLMVEKVIMSDGQMYSLLQLFSTIRK